MVQFFKTMPLQLLRKLVSILQVMVVNVLRCGPIPGHVSLIMDGNRRYARNKKMKGISGHVRGTSKVIPALRFCKHLGIKEITLYTFSIENFRRTEQEVRDLLNLIKGNMLEHIHDPSTLVELDICLSVVGDLKLLDEEFREVVRQIMDMTEGNSFRVNLAIAYTSREEMTSAIKDAVEKSSTNTKRPEEDLSRNLYVGTDVDMVIRTSGEVTVVNVLRCGPIPGHVSLIMDGNRRYARNKKMKGISGHVRGTSKVIPALRFCKHLGIKEITLYTFSIENFRRTEQEVRDLLNLIKDNMLEHIHDPSTLIELDICLSVVGDLKLLDEEFREIVRQIMDMTEGNSFRVNLAIAYTSREELTSAIKDAVEKSSTNTKRPEEDLSRNLYVGTDVDMVIRTSGEVMVVNVLRCGPIPGHVSLIMDGNRRYARNKKMKGISGHIRGTSKVIPALRFCKHLGIKEITLYTFSIENFRRTEQEVRDLLNLIKDNMLEHIHDPSTLIELDICLSVVGDLKLLDEEFREIVRQIMDMTEGNSFRVNLAIAYTSREEMTSAIKDAVEKSSTNTKRPEGDLSRNFYVGTDVDMVIRTSGEVRLSDFLLWQSTSSVLCFTDVLWPEFSAWNLIVLLLRYQKYMFNKNKWL